MSTKTPRSLLFLAVMAFFAGCDTDTSDPGVPPPDTSLSVYLTDAPGDVEAVWVDIAEIYFQGGPGGRTTVLAEPTGLIELTALQDRAVELISGLELETGSYAQLRFVLASAVLEASDGSVYVFGDAEHPSLPTTGELKCPGCTNSGLKVLLNGGSLAVEEGSNGLVLDFDVAQSFGRPAGQSGKWVMKPVIHGVKSSDGEDPEMPGAGASISGTVSLALDETGEPIALPSCPAETPRSIEDFVPLAVAVTLVDDIGEAVVRAGEVSEDATFSIDFLDADDYTMGYINNVEIGDMQLSFEATVEPAMVDLAADSDVSGVAYTIQNATCEPAPSGG